MQNEGLVDEKNIGTGRVLRAEIASSANGAFTEIVCTDGSWIYTYPTLKQAIDHAKLSGLFNFADTPRPSRNGDVYRLNLPADFPCESLGLEGFRYSQGRFDRLAAQER